MINLRQTVDTFPGISLLSDKLITFALRILFLDTNGNVMKDKINVGGNDKYKVGQFCK